MTRRVAALTVCLPASVCVLVWGTEATGLPERIPSAWRVPIESGGPTALPRDSKNVEVAFDCTHTLTLTYKFVCVPLFSCISDGS